MEPNINRRDLLKVMAALPLLKFSQPAKRIVSQSNQQQDVAEKPNIIVLVFDTLSAYHVSLYGYARETTPNLARIAERANVYHNHFATGNFTSPGTASLLTGTYPWTHRAFHVNGLTDGQMADRNIFAALDDDYYSVAYTHNVLVAFLLDQFKMNIDLWKPTRDLCIADHQLADLLFPNDYTPAYWTERNALKGINAPAGSLYLSVLDRGRRFLTKSQIDRRYRDQFPQEVPNDHTITFRLEDALDWLGAELRSLPQPYLTYFHVLPPHEPYLPPRNYIDRFEDDFLPPTKPEHFASEGHSQEVLNWQRQRYDEYLAYTDAELGRLYDQLVASGALDNAYLFVTSDHGELFERGMRGHMTPALYEPLLRIPLLVVGPGQTERQDYYTATSAVDILPTVTSLAGKSPPEWTEGQILPGFGQGPTDRTVFAVEAKKNPKHAPLHNATFAMIKGHDKLIYYRDHEDPGQAYELYDLENDPEELQDRYSGQSGTAADLVAEMNQVIAQADAPFQG